jgi:predicted HTH domain antitoxin
MRTVKINIPEDVEIKDFEFSMIVASKLYEEGKISAGQGAEIAGLSKRAFIELLGKYGVSVFSSDLTEMKSDITHA